MPVERIIVLTTDAAEAVTLLGAADKIVGVTDLIQKQSEYLPELQDRPVVGTWREFDYEKIAEIAMSDGDTIVPNIVVICYPSGSYNGMSYAVDVVEKNLAPFEGIAVIGFDLNKPETMEDELTTLGVILGKEDEAHDFLDWYYEKVEDVENAVEGLPVPSVYIERSASGLGDLKTAGTMYGIHKTLEIAGGYNICRERQSSPTVTWEWVMSKNPEVILQLPRTVGPSFRGLGWDESQIDLAEQLRSGLMTRDGAEMISAVTNDRVYVIYRDLLFGLDEVVGLTYLAKLLHPQVDLDPDDVYQEYLERMGLGYPEGRTFVYPVV